MQDFNDDSKLYNRGKEGQRDFEEMKKKNQWVKNYVVLIEFLQLDIFDPRGFFGGSAVKNSPAMQERQEAWVWFLGWEDPLEEGLTTHSSILA